MIGSNRVRGKMKSGEEVFGLLNSVPSPLICEMLGYAGYDFVVIDTEHLLLSPRDIEHSIRAAECAGITPFVRVPSCDLATIARALDSGAQGIVVPRVDSLEQAQEAISAVRFPPAGSRGITGGRNTGFGAQSIDDYMALSNREVMLVVMIESPQGLNALPSILTLQGIDMVLEGALDLSIAMGHGSNVQADAVQRALRQMAGCCAEAGVPFCAIPRQDGQLNAWRDLGVRAFLAGEDRGIIFRQLRTHLQSLQCQAK